jgi:hypothetical protein
VSEPLVIKGLARNLEVISDIQYPQFCNPHYTVLTDSNTCFHVVTIIKTNKRKVATMTTE